jgi:hypothetical protein
LEWRGKEILQEMIPPMKIEENETDEKGDERSS